MWESHPFVYRSAHHGAVAPTGHDWRTLTCADPCPNSAPAWDQTGSPLGHGKTDVLMHNAIVYGIAAEPSMQREPRGRPGLARPGGLEPPTF